MDRRDSIKSIVVGSITGGLMLSGCQPVAQENNAAEEPASTLYGRTETEKAHDARVRKETFLTAHEMATVTVLSALIVPATATAGSAKDAGVPEFIDFIVKDIPSHQTPIRGGLMWLDHRAATLFGQDFVSCPESQQKQLLDEIAYPNDASPEVEQGAQFFARMRNLVLTGYYTSEMGIKDLGYKGNTPNVWDGVPEDVLKKHGLSYDADWLAKCVDQDKRNITAQWDQDGNLIN